MRALFLVLALALPPLALPALGVARADSLPGCPPGQHLEMNPVQPGAMHHAGGQCVDDPGRCSVGWGGETLMPLAMLAASLVLLGARRQLGSIRR